MELSQLWPRVVVPPLDETQEIEYKAPVAFDECRRTVVRSVLAMSNTENGGLIVIGVTDNDGQKSAVGISHVVKASYNLQTLGAELSSYGSIGVKCRVLPLEHDDKEYFVVEVSPFEEYPIVCVKSLDPDQKGVRRGVIYYRNEKCEDKSADSNEFRRIMERTTRLALVRWGPSLSGCTASAGTSRAEPDDLDRYEKEIEGL